jgi:hypothetical protein
MAAPTGPEQAREPGAVRVLCIRRRAGARLPLDIASGAAVGLVVNATAGTAVSRYSTRHRG